MRLKSPGLNFLQGRLKGQELQTAPDALWKAEFLWQQADKEWLILFTKCLIWLGYLLAWLCSEKTMHFLLLMWQVISWIVIHVWLTFSSPGHGNTICHATAKHSLVRRLGNWGQLSKSKKSQSVKLFYYGLECSVRKRYGRLWTE